MGQRLLPHNAVKRHGLSHGDVVSRLCELAKQDGDKQAAAMACESLIQVIEKIKQDSAKRRGDSKWQK